MGNSNSGLGSKRSSVQSLDGSKKRTSMKHDVEITTQEKTKRPLSMGVQLRKVTEENNNTEEKPSNRPAPVDTTTVDLQDGGESNNQISPPTRSLRMGGGGSSEFLPLTRSKSFKTKPLSPRSGQYDNIASLLLSKQAKLRQQGNYDDLASLFMDEEDDNMGEFEFSMNTDNNALSQPTAVVRTTARPSTNKWTTTTVASTRKTRDDDQDLEEDDDVAGMRFAPAPPTIAKKQHQAQKRESYATGFVKSLFPSGRPSVHDLIVPYSTDMALVKQMVLNHAKRRELIQELIPLKGDLPTRVRFVAAVDQFEQTRDFTAQQNLGKKIIQLFFNKSSKFEIAFATETVKRVEEDVEFLVIARQEIIEALAKDEALMSICRSLANTTPVNCT